MSDAYVSMEKLFTKIKPESAIFLYDLTRWRLYFSIAYLGISMLKWMYEKGYEYGMDMGYIVGRKVANKN